MQAVCTIINNSSLQNIQPTRIISLVPSQTELLHYLGLDNEVIGITKFCIHPNQWFRIKTRIGGTKNIDIEMIKALNPTLIIANFEENVQEQIEQVSKICPVVVTNVNTLEDALQMIEELGAITNTSYKAHELVANIQLNFKELVQWNKKLHNATVAYLIWKEPYMTVGGDTFINNLLQICGLQNVFANEKRYPIISIEILQQIAPTFIFLSTEPYPFKEKHIIELQSQLPNSKIQIVDGEMFSWYGSKLLYVPKYCIQLIESLLN
ncbi:MAG TPA: helical backbone metal receptor [Chitinophagaceae bacterium]|nr:ABC transporter substrate-binding protein [Chitinophagaceae bacterium]MBP9739062.1 ABC transporter substrate-binding protein [Chitinophagaceae bacterium]HPH24968.1 helical backbone metal receptor [Chitinophagaceae bacterium]